MGLTINSEATHEADCPSWLMESAPSTETVFNGRSCLYFGGTSYFGLHADPGLMAEGVLRTVVFSTHTPAQIQRLLDELRRLV